MQWQELKIHVTKAQAPLVESILESNGAVSVYMDDAADQPLLEPLPGETPLWDSIIVTGLFEAEAAKEIDLDSLIEFIQLQFNPTKVYTQQLEDQVWERSWMDHYHPIECTQNLWIVPKWITPPNPDAINVLLDPGLAFGTGTHASTFLCLDWLAQQDLKDKVVIDFGCGSGILGVAALKLGAKQVYAVDIDPQAIIATQQNAELNNVENRLWAGLPDAFKTIFKDKAQMIVANILAKPLMDLAPEFADLADVNAQIVLAGLIKEQTEEVKVAYLPYFTLDELAMREDNWCRLSGSKK